MMQHQAPVTHEQLIEKGMKWTIQKIFVLLAEPTMLLRPACRAAQAHHVHPGAHMVAKHRAQGALYGAQAGVCLPRPTTGVCDYEFQATPQAC